MKGRIDKDMKGAGRGEERQLMIVLPMCLLQDTILNVYQ